MFKIIFLSLLIYIHSLYEAYVGGGVTWFKRKSTNEYIIVYSRISYSTASTYYIKDGNVALSILSDKIVYKYKKIVKKSTDY